MPRRYRPDAIAIHLQTIRRMLPGRKLSKLTCAGCGRGCYLLFLHPDDPDAWCCKLCQGFTQGRNGQYALSALARARNALQRVAHAHTGHAAAAVEPLQ